MLRLVLEEPGALDFYFKDENNKEHDMCLRCEDMYYLLYLNCYEGKHEYSKNIESFAKALNELLDVLSYIDSFNEYLDIFITDGFNEHRDLIRYLALEKQDFKIFGDNIYLIKKGKVKAI